MPRRRGLMRDANRRVMAVSEFLAQSEALLAMTGMLESMLSLAHYPDWAAVHDLNTHFSKLSAEMAEAGSAGLSGLAPADVDLIRSRLEHARKLIAALEVLAVAEQREIQRQLDGVHSSKQVSNKLAKAYSR